MEICTIGPPREYAEMLEKQNASKSCSYEKYKIDLNLDSFYQAACNFGPFSFFLSSSFSFLRFFRQVFLCTLACSLFLTCLFLSSVFFFLLSALFSASFSLHFGMFTLFDMSFPLLCFCMLFNMLKPITTSIISKQN